MHRTKWKKPVWKSYMPHESKYTTFWKRWNYQISKKSVVASSEGEGEMNKKSTKAFYGNKILCMILKWWIHVFINVSKPIECTIPRMKPKVNHGLWKKNMWANLQKGKNPTRSVQKIVLSRDQEGRDFSRLSMW